MDMNGFFNNGTQAGLLDSNGEKIVAGFHYEIDHKHLPSYIPWDLDFIRVGRVVRVTDVDVKIKYPTLKSLGKSYCKIGDCLRDVLLDNSYDIDNELVSKVLVKKVSHHDFQAKKHLRCFWLIRKRQFNYSHSTTLKNEQGPEVELGIEQQNLMQGDSGQKKRVKLESQTHVGIQMLHREIRPTWMAQERVRRGRAGPAWASTVPSTLGASHSTWAWASTSPSTPGASHSTRRSHIKFASKVVTLQKFEEISQDYEDHNDKNSPTFVVALSDSEDDIVVLSDIQKPQAVSLVSETSKKLKNLSLTNEHRLERNKKPETLRQTIDSDDANKSDSLNDEKMQQIINELLKVGLSELDVGKAAEICYNDPTKAKVLFGLPSHLRRSYVLGFLYPPS